MVATFNRLSPQIAPQAPSQIPDGAPEDSLLNRRLVNFLYERHVPDADGLEVQSHLGTVVISGRLASRHDKWLCLECCRRVAGVVKLIDQVEVGPSSTSGGKDASRGGDG